MSRLFYPTDEKLFFVPQEEKNDLECYHKKMRFFVQSESEFFKNLYCMLNLPKLSHFIIFSKVRLGDVINCYDKNFKENKLAWNRIAKTHVDFIICDANKDFEPVVAIELD